MPQATEDNHQTSTLPSPGFRLRLPKANPPARSGRRALACVAMVLLAALGARAQSLLTTVAVGASPKAIALNLLTNQIYVANFNGGTVTVIDGASNATTTLGVGNNPDPGPLALAVNPVTNRVYVNTLHLALVFF